MYKQESESELVFIALIMIALIPVAIIVNGFMIAYAWAELLMPIFPQLQSIGQWQAIGLSTFVSIFTAGLARQDNNNKDKSGKAIVAGIFFQWVLYFLIIWLVSQTY